MSTVNITFEMKNDEDRGKREGIHTARGIPKNCKFSGGDVVVCEVFKIRTGSEAAIKYNKKEAFLELNFDDSQGAYWESQIALSEIEDEGVKGAALAMLRKNS